MTRYLVIAGLLLLAVLVPLAALPVAIVVFAAVLAAAPFATAMRFAAPPLPLLALLAGRAPPSR